MGQLPGTGVSMCWVGHEMAGQLSAHSGQKLDRVLREALSGAPLPIVSAYVFGSHAEGRAHRESDLDVAVLLPHAPPSTAKEPFEARIQLTSLLMAALGGRAVDVVVLNDAPPLLARRIVTRGRRTLLTDAEADHAFVRDIQLRAADLEPFMRRMQRRPVAA